MIVSKSSSSNHRVENQSNPFSLFNAAQVLCIAYLHLDKEQP